jgi:4-amino-4-deoxy-L-arabinose transferase-like glycosyltransferase
MQHTIRTAIIKHSAKTNGHHTVVSGFSRAAEPIIVIALFGAALVLRLWALGWGLPYVEHPDEPAVLETAVRMVKEGEPNPGRFIYPSFYYYMLALVIRLHTVWGIAQGLYQSLADLPEKTYLYTVAPELYRWSRALTALLGALTIPLVYVLGRQMCDQRVGLISGSGLAVCMYHVQHSHFVTTDVPTGLWTTLAVAGAWGIATQGRWRNYMIGGVATGLAAGTKYNAGIVGIALGVAAVIYVDEHLRQLQVAASRRLVLAHSLRLLAASLIALAAFFLSTPFAILDFSRFWQDMQFNAIHYARGSHGDFIGPWRVDGYLDFFWQEALRPAGFLLLVAGIPLLVQRAPRQFAILSVAVATSVILLLTQSVNFVRNTLPIIPLLFVLTAAAIVYLGEWLAPLLTRSIIRLETLQAWIRSTDIVSHTATRYATPFIVSLLTLAFLIPHVEATNWLLNYWSRPHTLVAAAETLRAQPRGMLAAVEANPVQWANDPAVLPVTLLGLHSPDWYRSHGYRYVLINQERYGFEDQARYAQFFDGTHVLMALPDRSLGQQPGPGGALIDLGVHLELIPFTRRSAQFGNVVELLGYELAPGEPRNRITPLEGANVRVIASGEGLQINLYWRALAEIHHDYTLFIHVYDSSSQRVAQRDLPPRYYDYPTSRWRAGEIVIDQADVPLPSLPAGEYTLLIGLYNAETGERLPVREETSLLLTTFTVQHHHTSGSR